MVSLVGCFVDNTYVSTGVAFTCTITTTEQLTDNISAFYGDEVSRHGCSVTTAIDVFYTGLITTLNKHLGKGFLLIIICSCSLRRVIVSLITTTIDRCYIVCSTFIKWSSAIILIAVTPSEIFGLFYMYFDMSLWCTVQVVTTKDLLYFCTVEQHVDITTNEGLDSGNRSHVSFLSFCAYSCSSLSTQTTTKDVTVDSTGIKVHIRRLFGIEYHRGTTCLAGTGITQCRTAIDITVDGSISGIVSTCQGSHFHRNITIHQCRFTQATTKDNVGQRIRNCITPVGAYCTTCKRYFSITYDGSSRITTAINTL